MTLWEDPKQDNYLGLILNLINARYTLERPYWSHYTENAIQYDKFFGLVYMTAEPLSNSEKEADWKY